MRRDKIPGGLADLRNLRDFDLQELYLGISVEMEHTDDPEMAKEIALDHLTEHPDYYSQLTQCEAKMRKNRRRSAF